MRRVTRLQVAGTVALAAVIAVVAITVPPAEVLAALEHLRSRPLALAAVLAVVYLLRPLAAWPVSLVSAFVGYLLGPAVGLPVALTGAVVTALAPYALARHVGAAGPLGWVGRTARRGVDVTGGARGVLAARLAPLPTDAVSVAAGLADVSPRAFVLGTALGGAPWAVAAVFAGASAARIADGVRTPSTLVVGAAAVAVLLLAGPLYEQLATTPADVD